jgi:hypothetical protein
MYKRVRISLNLIIFKSHALTLMRTLFPQTLCSHQLMIWVPGVYTPPNHPLYFLHVTDTHFAQKHKIPNVRRRPLNASILSEPRALRTSAISRLRRSAASEARGCAIIR